MKRIGTMVLCLVLLVAALPLSTVTVSAATSGTTGDCKWSLSGTALTISGQGEMGDYDVANEQFAPWGTEITSVTIKEGVTSVGVGAFYLCTALTEVSLPDSLVEIRDAAFCGCASLQSVTIPDNVIAIGAAAFSVCVSLEEVVMPFGVDYIGDMAFYLSGLKKIWVPNSVSEMGQYVFAGCANLEEAYYECGACWIPEGTFLECENLRALFIDNSLEDIMDDAFSGCDNLTDVYYTGSEFDRNGYMWIHPGNDVLIDVAQWHYDAGPILLQQPEVVYNSSGSKATVTVRAMGDTLSYAWWIRDVGETEFHKVSANSSVYSVTMTSKTVGREAYCILRDGSNSVQTETVQLKPAIAIETQPKTTYAPLGKVAKVSVKAIGEGLTYQWYVKNPGSSKYVKSSNTTATYSMRMTEATSGRRVLCYIYDAYGNKVKTSSALIRMSVAITAQPETISVPRGEMARVTVKATGEGLTYRWYVCNAGSNAFWSASATGDTYSVKMTETTRNRQVYCQVSDKYENIVKTDIVQLRESISITTQPKTTYVQQGKVAKVPIKATGDGLTYQWYVKNPGSNTYVKSSNTTSTYSVKMTEAVSGRRVLCYVYDAWGNKVQSSSALIRMSATIVTQPKTVTVKKNTTAKVSVKAAGDGLTYTWYIKNAGSSKFAKSSVKTATYSVKMTNASKNRQLYCVVKDKYGKTVQTNTVTLKMK